METLDDLLGFSKLAPQELIHVKAFKVAELRALGIDMLFRDPELAVGVDRGVGRMSSPGCPGHQVVVVVVKA